MKRLFGWTLMILSFVFLPFALGEEEACCIYRIRPVLEEAAGVRDDGTVLIGSPGGKDYTAQILLSLEARSPSGDSVNLRQLLQSRHGTLLRASWRMEVRDITSPGSAFLLWPKGNKDGIISQRMTSGWNLWNVTELLRTMVKKEDELSLRLQARNDADRPGALFDISQSWIYVAVSFPKAEAEDHLITESDLLDAAFSALPDHHWALARYREISGSLIRSKWPETGVPYYYGGHSESKVLRPYSPSQPSRYYKTGRTYLNGFDCSGYMHWVENAAGYEPQDQLSDLIEERSSFFPAARKDMRNWMQVFLPGDLIVIDHGSWHVGMIIGTPRMYGLNVDNAPELASWLDAPMMIHCGEDPFVYERFKNYIGTINSRIKITPPDGGVTVSLLVNKLEDAPHSILSPWKTIYGYFEVLDQRMTVYPLSGCRRLAWVQPVRKDNLSAFLVEED